MRNMLCVNQPKKLAEPFVVSLENAKKAMHKAWLFFRSDFFVFLRSNSISFIYYYRRFTEPPQDKNPLYQGDFMAFLSIFLFHLFCWQQNPHLRSFSDLTLNFKASSRVLYSPPGIYDPDMGLAILRHLPGVKTHAIIFHFHANFM